MKPNTTIKISTSAHETKENEKISSFVQLFKMRMKVSYLGFGGFGRSRVLVNGVDIQSVFREAGVPVQRLRSSDGAGCRLDAEQTPDGDAA